MSAVNTLDRDRFESVARLIGDTPFTVTPYFFLQRGTCQVYADRPEQPRYGAIVPATPLPDIFVFGAARLDSPELESLAGFLVRLDPVGGYLVPIELVQAIRARRRIISDVEGLCFTYRQIPRQYRAWRPELVRALTLADIASIEALPAEAGFLFQNYGGPANLLTEGLAFGVFEGKRLASLSTSLALTPQHCDVGVYTVPRYRHRGYATDCVEVLFTHLFEQGIRPLWRIGIRQKVGLYFAEKLELDEIGTDGQEVYLQVCPNC